MRMPVMNVRVVRMLVRQRLMPVQMHMGLAAIPVNIMRMLMMLIMGMRVLMFQGLVRVLMIMRLCQV